MSLAILLQSKQLSAAQLSHAPDLEHLPFGHVCSAEVFVCLVTRFYAS
jgi:hypothetical protein